MHELLYSSAQVQSMVQVRNTNGWNPEVLIWSVARVMELFNSPVQRLINFALPLFHFNQFGLHAELFKLK